MKKDDLIKDYQDQLAQKDALVADLTAQNRNLKALQEKNHEIIEAKSKQISAAESTIQTLAVKAQRRLIGFIMFLVATCVLTIYISLPYANI